MNKKLIIRNFSYIFCYFIIYDINKNVFENEGNTVTLCYKGVLGYYVNNRW